MPEQSERMPGGLRLARTTPMFDEESVPERLLAAHRIADGVWGRLVVHSGALVFAFEDDRTSPYRVEAGESIDIPPRRPHRLILDDPVRFQIEFHRAADAN